MFYYGLKQILLKKALSDFLCMLLKIVEVVEIEEKVR